MVDAPLLQADLAAVREACDSEDWALAAERLNRHHQHVLQAVREGSINQEEAQAILAEQRQLAGEMARLQATAAAELGLLQRGNRALRAYAADSG